MPEARQWCRLFVALASPAAGPVLPHLGLRSRDAAVTREVGARAAQELQSILAATGDPATVDRANAALAGAYAELERGGGARVARATFAVAGDGFPGADEDALVAAWDVALLQLRDEGEAAGLPAAKRDIVVALLGHYFAAVEPLRALAVSAAAENGTGADRGRLVSLAHWRRFASVCRALAKVLTGAERERIVDTIGRGLPRRARAAAADLGAPAGSEVA